MPQWRTAEEIETNLLNDGLPKTRQSVAVQRDGASRLAKKIPMITLREYIFELFLLKKVPAISQWKIATSETIYTCAEDYL